MIDLSDCIELGTITKCHGVRGQILLRLSNLSFEDIKELEPVFIEIDGLPVPFFISSYEQRSNDTLVLSIDDVNKEEDTRELINCRVYVHSSQIAYIEDLLPQTDLLVGYTVIDIHLGKLGVIDEILDFESNTLLKILNEKKEILLPLHEDFVQEVDTANNILRVNAPEGIMDIS